MYAHVFRRQYHFGQKKFVFGGLSKKYLKNLTCFKFDCKRFQRNDFFQLNV